VNDGVATDAMPDDLGLLATDAMRARRHPWAIVGLWAWETGLALLVAWPAASLAGDVFGRGAEGDAALWTRGSLPLLDALWRNFAGLHAVASAGLAVLVVAAVAGLVPMASTLTVLAYANRDGRAAGVTRSLSEGVRLFPAMVLLLVLASMAQAATLGVGAGMGSLVEAWLHDSLGEARAQQVQGLVLLLALGAASAIGAGHDLARAAVVRFKVGGGRATLLGARTLRLAPLGMWWSWAWRAGASLAPIVAAAWVTGRLGGRGGVALVVVFALHQLVVGARVALRTSWLARALRAVDATLRRVA
jgi:hypothetical protein